MLGEQSVAETLLPSARCSRPQPVGVGHICWEDDMNGRRVVNPKGRQDVRGGIEGIETLVHCDLDNRGGRIQAGVEDTRALLVPAAAKQVGSLPGVPRRRNPGLIEAPTDEVTGAERMGQWRHV